ncbi:biotin synthase BioB [bacterium]|uniref:Biotin synthase n=1 Tax=Rubinisphaera brasiliensis (strain ATCC 49424 / DSM 5305 / JCM 21570 / IAM 15109 / NBRC 103401 / IFAM 1448) TaxID=756272 RepID=F0SKN4_RUBBR|nr:MULTISPECIES: biotin synthase BioB [Rubinisphaera]ADY58704.1 biotin synthase [Rubinisphaera brasiliensis DSM 5305]MBR9802209.1 biotin synthase BioB [bacterium]
MTTTIESSVSWNDLATRAISGEPLDRVAAQQILACPDEELLDLLAAAFRVRRQAFGNQVQLYYLKNAKSGLCPEDCGYCSQSKVSDAPIEKYVWLNEEKLLAGARQAAENKAKTYCIVASGRGPTNREVDHVAGVVKKIKEELGMHICCCLGLLKPEQAKTLAEAGVDRINHNLNTSREYYDTICSTHTYQDRLDTLKVASETGMELCSGIIVGMGETDDDLVNVALELRDLNVKSIPVNFLTNIEGTPLEKVETLTPQRCLKALCLFRMMHPNTELRIAGGREVHLRTLQPLGLYPANSLFVSDYLTTKGQTASEDFKMLEDLGFEVVVQGAESDARGEVTA